MISHPQGIVYGHLLGSYDHYGESHPCRLIVTLENSKRTLVTLTDFRMTKNSSTPLMEGAGVSHACLVVTWNIWEESLEEIHCLMAAVMRNLTWALAVGFFHFQKNHFMHLLWHFLTFILIVKSLVMMSGLIWLPTNSSLDTLNTKHGTIMGQFIRRHQSVAVHMHYVLTGTAVNRVSLHLGCRSSVMRE